MNNTKFKKIQSKHGTGEISITPRTDHSQVAEIIKMGKQVVEICFVNWDPDGKAFDYFLEISGSPENLPNKVLGKLANDLFNLKNFDVFGQTIISCEGGNEIIQETHIHSFGTVDAFDVDDWDATAAVDELLNKNDRP